jgi:hypothetical protein
MGEGVERSEGQAGSFAAAAGGLVRNHKDQRLLVGDRDNRRIQSDLD